MTISAPFANVLSAGRAQFNQRVTEARRRFPAFDTNAFADFLQAGVDRVVRSVVEIAPEQVPLVVMAAYDIALELIGQALAGPGSRITLVDQVWHDVAPKYARLAAQYPAEVLGSLSNAAIYIAKTSNARNGQWVAEMIALAPHATSLPYLQAIGQVLAWRAGLAHFRTGAIEAADQLPENVALAAFGVANSMPWTTVRDQLLADPWWKPDRENRDSAGMEIGGFDGFGGEFAAPPEVRACQEGFVVKSTDRYFLLIADAYGGALHAATAEEFEHANGRTFNTELSIHDSRLFIKGKAIALDLPPDGIHAVCNSHTVAVTSPCTHAIRLLPLR
jgi:hypothetical protein